MRAIIIILALVLSTSAEAKVVRLKSAGFWSTYYSDGINYDRRPYKAETETACFMQTGDEGGKLFYVRYSHDTGLYLQWTAPHWNLKPDDQTRVTIQFDNGPIVDYAATSRKMYKVDRYYLRADVPEKEHSNFLTVFSRSNRIIIRFPDGDEPMWDGSMKGSNEAFFAFHNCVKGMNEGKAAADSINKTSPISPPSYSPIKKPPSPDKDIDFR